MNQPNPKDEVTEHKRAWKEIALSVSRMNRDAAASAITDCYRAAGLMPPKTFVFLGSPVKGALAAATLVKQQVQSAFIPVVANLKANVEIKYDEQFKLMSSQHKMRNAVFELTEARGSISYARIGPNLRAAFERWCATYWNMEGWFDPDPADSLMQELCHQLPTRIVERLPLAPERGSECQTQLSRCAFGAHDAFWLQLYDYAVKSGFQIEELGPLVEVAKHCGWWWPFHDICIVTDRPKLLAIDSEGRFHRATGPAAEYRDGLKVFAWRGGYVPKRVVWFSQNMNIFDIDDEPNVEARRFMIDMYGLDNFIRDAKARKIDDDKYGKLYIRELLDDEPIVLLEVLNSSPEPDGTYKTYFLRVPPHCRTSREAVAWTFGLRPEQYNPLKET